MNDADANRLVDKMIQMVRPKQYILNEKGDPVPEPDLIKWAVWMETAHRTIAQDFDEGETDPAKKVRVSTVFLGLDHRFSGDGPPILWETLVFGGVCDGDQDRYTSKEEALMGHQDMCRKVAATMERP